MSDTIIKFENLGKKYIIGHQQQQERYTALRDVIANSARSFLKHVNLLYQVLCSNFWPIFRLEIILLEETKNLLSFLQKSSRIGGFLQDQDYGFISKSFSTSFYSEARNQLRAAIS